MILRYLNWTRNIQIADATAFAHDGHQPGARTNEHFVPFIAFTLIIFGRFLQSNKTNGIFNRSVSVDDQRTQLSMNR